MATRPRFPGRPPKNPKARKSFSNSDVRGPASASPNLVPKRTEESGYEKIAAQTATNLKAFRMLFGTSEEEDEVFTGFKKNGKLARSCKKKLTEIRNEIEVLTAQSNPDNGSRKVPLVKHNVKEPAENGSTSESSQGFRGFMVNDPMLVKLRKKRQLIENEIISVSSSEETSCEMNNPRDRVKSVRHRLKSASSINNSSPLLINTARSTNGISHNNHKMTNGFDAASGKSIINGIGQNSGMGVMSHGPATNNSHVNNLQASAISSSKTEVPVVDHLNFRRVKGPRVKQVSHFSGMTPALPLARFGDLLDIGQMPATLAPGVLRSGKFAVDESDDEEEDEGMDFEDDFSEDHFHDISLAGANGEAGRMYEEEEKKAEKTD